MVKILKYDNPDHKIKLRIRQIQVLRKSTGQINNTGYEWYIGSYSMQSPGAPNRASMICLMHDTHHLISIILSGSIGWGAGLQSSRLVQSKSSNPLKVL